MGKSATRLFQDFVKLDERIAAQKQKAINAGDTAALMRYTLGDRQYSLKKHRHKMNELVDYIKGNPKEVEAHLGADIATELNAFNGDKTKIETWLNNRDNRKDVLNKLAPQAKMPTDKNATNNDVVLEYYQLAAKRYNEYLSKKANSETGKMTLETKAEDIEEKLRNFRENHKNVKIPEFRVTGRLQRHDSSKTPERFEAKIGKHLNDVRKMLPDHDRRNLKHITRRTNERKAQINDYMKIRDLRVDSSNKISYKILNNEKDWNKIVKFARSNPDIMYCELKLLRNRFNKANYKKEQNDVLKQFKQLTGNKNASIQNLETSLGNELTGMEDKFPKIKEYYDQGEPFDSDINITMDGLAIADDYIKARKTELTRLEQIITTAPTPSSPSADTGPTEVDARVQHQVAPQGSPGGKSPTPTPTQPTTQPTTRGAQSQPPGPPRQTTRAPAAADPGGPQRMASPQAATKGPVLTRPPKMKVEPLTPKEMAATMPKSDKTKSTKTSTSNREIEYSELPDKLSEKPNPDLSGTALDAEKRDAEKRDAKKLIKDKDTSTGFDSQYAELPSGNVNFRGAPAHRQTPPNADKRESAGYKDINFPETGYVDTNDVDMDVDPNPGLATIPEENAGDVAAQVRSGNKPKSQYNDYSQLQNKGASQSQRSSSPAVSYETLSPDIPEDDVNAQVSTKADNTNVAGSELDNATTQEQSHYQSLGQYKGTQSAAPATKGAGATQGVGGGKTYATLPLAPKRSSMGNIPTDPDQYSSLPISNEVGQSQSHQPASTSSAGQEGNYVEIPANAVGAQPLGSSRITPTGRPLPNTPNPQYGNYPGGPSNNQSPPNANNNMARTSAKTQETNKASELQKAMEKAPLPPPLVKK